jgi:RimJ/RimL family protein N-acetyltransferase
MRPLRADDEDALARAFADRELWTWMLVERPSSRDEVRAWIEGALALRERGEQVPFVAELPDGTLAGTSRYLDIRAFDRGVEIGWTMFFAHARGGWINGRAKLLMLGRAFEAGFERVQLKTDARNLRSRGAIAAIGASFEGILRSYQRRADGSLRDTAMFSIVAADWPEVRRTLEARTAERKGRTPEPRTSPR